MSFPLNKAIDFAEKVELALNELSYEYLDKSFALLIEEFHELRTGLIDKNKLEIVDGAFDVAFVAFNMAYKLLRMEYGALEARKKTIAGFDAVCENNLSKLWEDGKPRKNEVGKIIKPDNFKPVDLKFMFE